MKVAINTLFLIPGEVGGSETYLRETLLAIARQYPDIELALVTNKENDDLLRSLYGGFSQCTFHLLPIRATNRYVRIIAEQTRLPWMLRTIKPDVLWSPGYTAPLFYAGKQVVTIHDMQYRSYPDDLGFLARLVTHILVCGAARRCDGIIAISEFTKREILKHTAARGRDIHVTLEGVDPGFGESDRCSVFGVQEDENPVTGNQQAGINLHHPTSSPNTEHRTPKPSSLQPYVLSVANSYPHKNLHRLVDAFALLLDRIPHQLVIVGRPRLGEPQLVKSLSKIPPDRVHRVAGLSRQELIELYQSADLFVFPSLYEGFGLPVLEAMMAGVPVVTTREGSIPEVGGDEVTYTDGRDPTDLAAKILETINLPTDARQSRLHSARARATTFTWSIAADKTVAAWQSV
jgi:glycosyltransferase involved in cell wall biosynthesis